MSEKNQPEFIYDKGRQLLRLTLSGFLSKEDAEKYAAELHSKAAQIHHEKFVCLVDATDFAPQAQSTVSLFGGIIAALPNRPEKIAIVTLSALLKMQLARLPGAERRKAFSSDIEALEWLLPN